MKYSHTQTNEDFNSDVQRPSMPQPSYPYLATSLVVVEYLEVRGMT